MHEHDDPPGSPPPTLEDFERARALPPPAFPPGFRRVSVRRGIAWQGRRKEVLAGGQMLERSAFPAEPIISPDEPIPDAHADDPADALDPEKVVVTGTGDGPRPDADGPAPGDIDVAALTEQLTSLAEALRHEGEFGLRAHPGLTHFEVTLRAYCAGYLAARRSDEEPA